jgi:hypothetical protein
MASSTAFSCFSSSSLRVAVDFFDPFSPLGAVETEAILGFQIKAKISVPFYYNIRNYTKLLCWVVLLEVAIQRCVFLKAER